MNMRSATVFHLKITGISIALLVLFFFMPSSCRSAEPRISGTIKSISPSSGIYLLQMEGYQVRVKAGPSCRFYRLRGERAASDFSTGEKIVISVSSSLSADPLIASEIMDCEYAEKNKASPVAIQPRRYTEIGDFPTSAAPSAQSPFQTKKPGFVVQPAPCSLPWIGEVITGGEGNQPPYALSEEESLIRDMPSKFSTSRLYEPPATVLMPRIHARLTGINYSGNICSFVSMDGERSQGTFSFSHTTQVFRVGAGGTLVPSSVESLCSGSIVECIGDISGGNTMMARVIYIY